MHYRFVRMQRFARIRAFLYRLTHAPRPELPLAIGDFARRQSDAN